MDIDQVLDDCKKILKEHYGSRFQGLFLYGSMARGQKEQGSDMDLFVLLSRPFDYFHELRTIVDLLYPVQLKADWLISAKPAARDEFESGTINLYRVAKREGKATQYMKSRISKNFSKHIQPSLSP